MAERCDWLARIGFGRAFVKHSVEYFVRLMNEVLRIQCLFQWVAMLVLIQADC